MYTLNFDEKITVHFMGIGGISMSGLAEILLSEGFTVQGSDMSESDIVKSLIAKGAKVYIGQKKENITSGIDLVVYTAAIRQRRIPGCKRSRNPNAHKSRTSRSDHGFL